MARGATATCATAGHAFSLVVFRDVMAVDGKAVRNRDERLRKLLMSERKQESYDQAVRITNEGARYDIGLFSGSKGNVDPLIKRERSGSIAIRGLYVLDGQGRVSETFWATDDPDFDRRVTVRYREHANLPVLVPSEMLRHEQVTREAKSDFSDAHVTYSNCRQFQVTVEETIQLPKP